MNQCEIEGHEIPVDTMLLVCQSEPHYLESYFGNPCELDIECGFWDRAEYQQTGAFAPYGLSTHVFGSVGSNCKWQ